MLFGIPISILSLLNKNRIVPQLAASRCTCKERLPLACVQTMGD